MRDVGKNRVFRSLAFSYRGGKSLLGRYRRVGTVGVQATRVSLQRWFDRKQSCGL